MDEYVFSRYKSMSVEYHRQINSLESIRHRNGTSHDWRRAMKLCKFCITSPVGLLSIEHPVEMAREDFLCIIGQHIARQKELNEDLGYN